MGIYSKEHKSSLITLQCKYDDAWFDDFADESIEVL